MVNIIIESAKYLMIILMVIYTFQCFAVFSYSSDEKKNKVLNNQSILVFAIHTTGFISMFFKTFEWKMIVLYLGQFILFVLIFGVYKLLFQRASKLVVNNMCMLLAVGFIVLARLSFNKSVRQTIIAAGAFVISIFVPFAIRKIKLLSKWTIIYALLGLGSLLSVFILGQVSYGAKLGISIGSFSIQLSELVKILFVFFVAASLKKHTEFKRVVITTVVAAFHVLILVISKDLGAALIIFVVYIVMLYVASKKWIYPFAGVIAGCFASIIAYQLFDHIKVRVVAWQDPFSFYETGGYQIAQSMFAIGTGGWFGTGLFQGKAHTIPVADEDFIFSAIVEELGLVFALCLILICLSCYVMFLNIAMQLKSSFYKLIALGLGTCYIFQTFLTVGGTTKFIPSTGVTLPLVSYGGSSVLSTLIMFAIIQGLYILRDDEEIKVEKSRKEKERTGYNTKQIGRTGRTRRPTGKHG